METETQEVTDYELDHEDVVGRLRAAFEARANRQRVSDERRLEKPTLEPGTVVRHIDREEALIVIGIGVEGGDRGYCVRVIDESGKERRYREWKLEVIAD